VTDAIDAGRLPASGPLPDDADLDAAARALLVKTNQVIEKVTVDVEQRFHFNTALAATMELTNEISGFRGAPGPAASGPDDVAAATPAGTRVLAEAVETLVRLLEPFAPHMCAELWQLMGRERIWDEPWPQPDPCYLTHDTIELAVQVNGKVRDRVVVPADATDDHVLAAVKELPGMQRYLEGVTVVKEIVVPGRLVNIVVRSV